MAFSLLRRNRENFTPSLPESRDRRSAVSNAATATVEVLEGRRLMSGDSSFIFEYSGRNNLEVNVVTGMTLRQTNLGQLRGWNAGFEDRNPANYSVTIHWDDETSSQGKVIRNPDPRASDPDEVTVYPLLIKGSHKYTAPSPSNDPYDVKVTIRHVRGAVYQADAADFTVVNLRNPDGRSGPRTDPPELPALRSLGDSFVVAYTEAVHTQRTGVSLNNVRLVNMGWARFNGQENYDASLWRAQINWGDGSAWETGKVVSAASIGKSDTGMLVVGSHTYYNPGTYTAMVNIVGPDGTTFPMESHALSITVTGPVVTPPSSSTMLKATVSQGTLKVEGTAGPDKITIKQLVNGALELISGTGTGASRRTFSDPSIKRIEVAAGGGNDEVKIDTSVTRPARIDGGIGNDTLIGSSMDDVILGGADNDKIFGSGGDDYLHGGDGNDTIFGGMGNDRLYSGLGGGVDILHGEVGDDNLVSFGGGADVVTGGTGRDVLWTDTRDLNTTDSGDRIHRIPGFVTLSQPKTPWLAPNHQQPSLQQDGQEILDPNPVARRSPASTDAQYVDYSNRPLFGPTIELRDVRQGRLGDCFQQAAMAGIAATRPDLIGQIITDAGDGTYVVAFKNPDGSRAYMRIDGDLPTAVGPSGRRELLFAKEGVNGSIWAAMVEKAMAFRRGDPLKPGSYGGYDHLVGGLEEEVYKHFGIRSRTTDLRKLADKTPIMKTILRDLDDEKACTIGTAKTVDSIKLYGNHVYLIVGVSTDKSGRITALRLYNPHGGDDANRQQKGGIVNISWTEFAKCVETYTAAEL
jgi:hypothetical protein